MKLGSFLRGSDSVVNQFVMGEYWDILEDCIEATADWVWTGEWNSEELPDKINQKQRTTIFVGAFH